MLYFTIFHFVVFLLIYYLADAYHDKCFSKEKYYRSISATEEANRYRYRWHSIDALIKGLVVFTISWAFCDYLLNWIILFLTIFAITTRWIYFDAVYNLINKKSFWYRGSVAKLDKLNFSDFFYFFMKFFLFAISIYLVIIFL